MSSYGQQLISIANVPTSGSTRVPTRYQQQIYNECVAHIANEINASNYAVCGFGKKRHQARDLAKQWARECRSAAILPLLWWIVKPWILSMLIELAERWLAHLATGSTVTITGTMSAEAHN